MVKDDCYYIEKIIDDIDFIIEHMENQTQQSLESNPVLLDSMMFRLIQISESAKCISDAFKNTNSKIPWTAIYGLRNRLVHDYGNVNLGIVYRTLKYDVVSVRDIIKKR